MGQIRLLKKWGKHKNQVAGKVLTVTTELEKELVKKKIAEPFTGTSPQAKEVKAIVRRESPPKDA